MLSRVGIYFLALSAYLLVCPTSARNISDDHVALLSFKSYIVSDPDQILARNWSVAVSVCDWIGVTCSSRHSRVTALNISRMGIIGNISPHLSNLSFLVSLDMERNHFQGQIPPELSRLRQLRYFSLSFNNLTGEIPPWIGLLNQMQYLSLGNNSFSGPIPPSISNLSRLEFVNFGENVLQGMIPGFPGKMGYYFPGLKYINMNGNQLTGPIPFTIYNISTLEVLMLSRNRLSSSLPVDLCRGTPLIKELILSGNSLEGQIPYGLSNCSELRLLYLSYNNLFGFVPNEISKLRKLEQLALGVTNLEGEIPREFGNLTMLKVLDIVGCNFTGTIPKEIGNLYNLEEIGLSDNWLKGSIPGEIFNISSLQRIGLSLNNLSGNLPPNMGSKLNNLERLFLNWNDLSGVIPSSISNASNLIILTLRYNKFSGPVPTSLGNLRDLISFNIARNRLSSDSFSSPELSFITSLTNCSSLRYLIVNDNHLNGILPASIGNFSTSLESIYAARSQVKGRIPNEIGNLSSLLFLDLSENELTGSIPRSFQDLQNLQRLSLASNKLGETFPNVFCGLPNLGIIELSKCELWGPIPECLGNVTSLGEIYLDSNRLTSIPTSMWNLRDLNILNLYSNSISGFLPREIGNLKAATVILLSTNQLSGTIPTTIGELQNLRNLSIANNSFQGSIPVSIGIMLSLEVLDLSRNNLSGSIPKSMEALQFLKYFNVSYNGLSGEIPSGGPFGNFTNQSFVFNEAFCGSSRFNVPPCLSGSYAKSSRKGNVRRIAFILSGVVVVLLVAIMVLIVLWYRKRQKKHPGGTDNLLSVKTYGRFSYYELLQATGGYSESNLLGTGSFGSVYKAILRDGTHLAVKVFNLQVEDAFKSFDTECEVLRNLRHRNLTKVLGSCSNLDFKALVLEYMSNGSLEKWLYSHNYFLDLIQRLNIMIDVASALEYLHHGNVLPVVHCDMKPSNILLDQDMIGHVSDFGIAKMLGEGQSDVHTRTLATLGYIAPEYGLEGIVSTRSDVYSFGIVMMETFSRKKPSDEMFSGDISLKSWIEDALPDEAIRVIDANLINQEEENVGYKMECISKILELGLRCCNENPGERMNINDVVVEMKKIRDQFATSAKVLKL